MNKWVEKITDIADDVGWKTYIDEDSGTKIGIEFEKGSPAGEDFSFYASGTDAATLIGDVDDYAIEFDLNDHVAMWLDAKRNGVSGVPDVTELVEDAHAIKDMLYELANALRNNIK